MHTVAGETVELWLEEKLWSLESNETLDAEDGFVWELVVLVVGGRVGGLSSECVELTLAIADEAEIFLDLLDDLQFRGGGEVPSELRLAELLDVLGESTTGNIHSLDSVWDGETLIDWDSMANTITRVNNETSGSSGGVERHDSLDGDIESWNKECLEHDLSHLLSVLLWLEWGFSEEHSSNLLWVDSEAGVESVMPDSLHIFPRLNLTMSNWIGDVKDSSFLCGFLTNVVFFG